MLEQDSSKFARLTNTQRETLDLIIDRRSNKEIAGMLGCSESLVEKRLRASRKLLGLTSRAQMAREYARFSADYGKTATECGKDHLPGPRTARLFEPQDGGQKAVVELADSAAWGDVGWARRLDVSPFLEALEQRFGIVGKFGTAIILAMIITVSVAAVMSIGLSFNQLL